MLGVWVNVHLCDGVAESIQVFQETADCCCEDQEGMRDECCKDEKVYFQMAQEVKHTPASLTVFKPLLYVLYKINTFETPSILNKEKEVITYCDENNPPKEKIYLLNSSLVLYS